MKNFEMGIIDDDENILYTVKAMGDTLGWNVRVSTSPHEALSWVENNAVDILLVDYHMPAMSGLEVIRQARAISKNVILLVLTVEESPQVAQDLLLAGADDFITKPLRLADFSSRVSLHAELLQYRRTENPEGHQKGFSEATLRRIYELFENEVSLNVNEVAEQCGLAYPTAHRYLEQLVKKGQLNRRVPPSDGKSGRPKTLYRAAGKEE